MAVVSPAVPPSAGTGGTNTRSWVNVLAALCCWPFAEDGGGDDNDGGDDDDHDDDDGNHDDAAAAADDDDDECREEALRLWPATLYWQ